MTSVRDMKVAGLKLLLFSMVIILSGCAGEKPPVWYTELPAGANFYHGVGIVQKTSENAENIRELARNAALADIASQIRVNIESEMSSVVTESAGGIDEKVDFISQSRTAAVLTGVEQVQIFEDETSYGIYMRLSRTIYQQESEKICKLGVAEAQNYLDQAQADNVEPTQVLQNKLYALNKLSMIEDLLTRYDQDGSSVKTISEIRSSLAEWFGQLELSTSMDKANWVMLKGLVQPIPIYVTQMSGSDRVALKRFPLQVSFGSTSFKIQANDSGMVKLETIHFDSVTASGIISIEPDVAELAGEQGKVLPFLKTVQLPKIQLNLAVRGPLMEIRANETALDKPMDHPYLSPILKTTLQKAIQAEFVDGFGQNSVDYVISLNARSVEAGPPTETYGKTIYKCLTSVEVNVLDAQGEEVLFTTHLQDVDGAAFSGYDAASQKSYAKMSKRFETEIVPKLTKLFRGETE